MNKTIRLPNALTIAFGQYFLNYQLSKPQTSLVRINSDGTKTTETTKGRHWDKNADLERISASMPKGWVYQPCAGTFWIFPAKVKKHHYYMHCNIWPLAEMRLN